MKVSNKHLTKDDFYIDIDNSTSELLVLFFYKKGIRLYLDKNNILAFLNIKVRK